MALKVEGKVAKVNRVNDKKWSKISVIVNEQWYSGFINDKITDDREKVKEGDAVVIEYVQNGRYFNIEKLTITTPSVAQAPAHADHSEAKPQAEVYLPQAVRELRITIASARNSAIEFVRLAVDCEALALSDKKKGYKIDNLLQHVNHYTKIFAVQLLASKEEDFKEVPNEDNNKKVESTSDYSE